MKKYEPRQTLGSRFRELRKSLNLTAADLASALEISRGYLSEIENDKSVPGDKIGSALTRLYGVNWAHLKAGEEPFFLPQEVNKSIKPDASDGFGKQLHKPAPPTAFPIGRPKPAGPAFYLVPRLDVRVSAGPGDGGPDTIEARTDICFSPAYMRRHFGRASDGFCMLYVKGDSMHPTLRDGDEIVIDTHVRSVDRDGIYVFSIRGDHRVKRIQLKLDGSLIVKSDNDAYEQELVTAKGADGFQVEGRLVWPRLR